MTEQVPDPPKSKLYSPWQYDSEAERTHRTARSSLGMPRLQLFSVWYGIVLAAGCFPCVLMLITLARSTVTFDFPRSLPETLISIPFIFAISIPAGIAGLIWGSVISLPAYLLTQWLGWILKGILSDRGAIGIFGGLTGFLCTTGGGLIFADAGPAPFDFWFLPLLAIAMGHLGATWACYSERNRKPYVDFFEPILSLEKQITIGFLMKLTVAVALLVVILKAAGTAGLNIGIAWGFYIVVQACLLFCDHLITRWLSRRSAIQAASQN